MKKKFKKKPLLKAQRVDKVGVVLLLLWFAIIIVVSEKVKWIAGKEWGSPVIWISALSTLGIIVTEYSKYFAVRRIRKLLKKKEE